MGENESGTPIFIENYLSGVIGSVCVYHVFEIFLTVLVQYTLHQMGPNYGTRQHFVRPAKASRNVIKMVIIISCPTQSKNRKDEVECFAIDKESTEKYLCFAVRGNAMDDLTYN